jgi:hypothetical protein
LEECSTTADQIDYSLPHVKFFLHRNGVRSYPDIDSIAEQTTNDPRVRAIITELQQWPCREITNHKQVNHPLHKLSFLADLGFTIGDPGISAIIEQVLSNQSAEGALQVIVKIPARFGGSGEATRGWMASDAPVLLCAAARMNEERLAGSVGPGFQKLKLPLVWYDILNVVDPLSAYRTLVADRRFDERWQRLLY